MGKGDTEEITVGLGTGVKDSTVSLRIGGELNQKLESEAATRDIDKSEVIRDACRRLLESSSRT